jgi:TolB-like protein
LGFLAELRRRNVFRIAAAYLVAGWVVMQVVDVIARASGLPDWADSLALIFLVVGFPIALIVAWAFELTPEGPRRTGPRQEGERVKPFRPADAILVAALVVVIGAIAWQQLSPRDVRYVEAGADDPAGPEAASIAVLAFDDLSPGGDQEYFSDGISEELLNVLVRVDGLRVASRTSAFQFKGRDIGIPEIAEQLNVRHVVEGSVRRAGDTIRITAQLIDSESDGHLWSETYDRELTTSNIFAVQEEIATAIVAALSEELGTTLPSVEVETATENLTAYELYLQARPHFLARDDFDEADALLARAVELDPTFAEAWEMRAAIHALYATIGGQFRNSLPNSIEASAELAVTYAETVLSLKPESSLAITVLTYMRYPLSPSSDGSAYDFTIMAGAIDGFSQALAIDPHNATARNWRGLSYMNVGYLQEARTDFAACVEVEPLYAPCRRNLATAFATLGDDEAAYRTIVEGLSLGMPSFAEFGVLARLGKRDLFLFSAAGFVGPNAPWGRHETLYEMYRDPEGDFDHLIPAIAAWLEQDDNAWIEFFATPDMIIGNYDAAPDYLYMIWTPELAGWRQSERFQEYITALKLPTFWREYGFPPQCHERDDGWIECT